MAEHNWQERGQSFGNGAETYDRTRPDYRPETVEWILGDKPRTVVELGAGTGILTRRLLSLGHRVSAVEPDDAMRERITATAPAAEVLAGGAESIAVPDGSADAVLVGHAYHWFDPEPAHAEMARVLRPGGTLATLWNLRDEEVPWSAELSRILGDEDTGTDRETAAAIMLHGALGALRDPEKRGLSGWLKNPSFGPRFGDIEIAFFPNSQTLTVETLVALVKSRSYYLTSSPERQIELEKQVRDLAATHPDLAGRDEFELPYITVVFKATRTD
jgi:SAM-dependent methyltransferase